MKYFKVKNIATGRVSVMSEKIFEDLSSNKNFFIDSDKTETVIKDEKEVEVPIKITPFEKGEEVNESGFNFKEEKEFSKKMKAEKAEKDKLKK